MSIKTEIEWFSCEEDMPPKKEPVLIKIKGDGDSTYMGSREGDTFFTPLNHPYNKSEILLWAHFPELPEVE